MKDKYKVGRVIARPFIGENKDNFTRTSNRHDYAISPTGKTVLDELKEINGEFFTVKNDCLKVFNLIQNHFTEKSFDNIIKLLNGNQNTILTIEGKPYTKEQKAMLKDSQSEHKYGDRVFLLK